MHVVVCLLMNDLICSLRSISIVTNAPLLQSFMVLVTVCTVAQSVVFKRVLRPLMVMPRNVL